MKIEKYKIPYQIHMKSVTLWNMFLFINCQRNTFQICKIN